MITEIQIRAPIKKVDCPKVKLPKRQRRHRCKEIDYPFKKVPQVF